MNFTRFAGNESVKESLNNDFASGRLPHALILQGDDGLGKRTLAKLIAMAAVCRGDNRPCMNCPACIRAMASSHPDIRVIEGAGASGAINVDSVKSITSDAYRKPDESDYSVYLLFAGSSMPEITQNKLLKIIEEPPDGVVFVIVIKSADSLLPTIRSRARILTLRPVKNSEAAEFAVKHHGADPDAALKAAGLFNGNIGRMLQFLNGSKTSDSQETAAKIASLLDSTDEHLMLAAAAPMIKDKALFSEVMDYLAAIFRDACVLRAGGSGTIGTDASAAEKLAAAQVRQRLILLPGICMEFKGYAGRNANMNLLVTAFCARLRNAVLK